MLVRATHRSRVPLYVQIASVLRSRIQSGQWQAGKRVSTLDELEREFQVTRETARQAVDVLRKEGLLRARQGLGTFVSSQAHDRRTVKLASDWRGLVQSLTGVPLGQLTIYREAAPPHLGEVEGIAAASYVNMKSVYCRDGSPYSSVSIHLAGDIFELGRDRFQSMASIVVIDDMNEVRIRAARQTLTIGCADPHLAAALEVPVGSPTLVVRRVIVDERGVAIYIGHITYRSDAIQMEMDLLLDHPGAAWKPLRPD